MFIYDYDIQIEGVDLRLDFEYESGTPQKINRSRKPWDSEPEITELVKVTLEGSDIDIINLINEDQIIEQLEIKFFDL